MKTYWDRMICFADGAALCRIGPTSVCGRALTRGSSPDPNHGVYSLAEVLERAGVGEKRADGDGGWEKGFVPHDLLLAKGVAGVGGRADGWLPQREGLWPDQF